MPDLLHSVTRTQERTKSWTQPSQQVPQSTCLQDEGEGAHKEDRGEGHRALPPTLLAQAFWFYSDHSPLWRLYRPAQCRSVGSAEPFLGPGVIRTEVEKQDSGTSRSPSN